MAGDDLVTRLWIRTLSERAPRPLLGTETPFFHPFFWSPDSTAIAFDASGADFRRPGIKTFNPFKELP